MSVTAENVETVRLMTLPGYHPACSAKSSIDRPLDRMFVAAGGKLVGCLHRRVEGRWLQMADGKRFDYRQIAIYSAADDTLYCMIGVCVDGDGTELGKLRPLPARFAGAYLPDMRGQWESVSPSVSASPLLSA